MMKSMTRLKLLDIYDVRGDTLITRMIHPSLPRLTLWPQFEFNDISYRN